MSRILVVGDARDVQTAHQIQTLRRLGAEVIAVQPTTLPGFSWSEGEHGAFGVNFNDVDGALIRALPSEQVGADAFAQGPLGYRAFHLEACLAKERADAMLSTLLALELRGVACMNAPSKSLLSRRKPFQLEVLRAAGCALPDTLISNDPLAIRAFAHEMGECIVKPVAGGALTRSLDELDDDTLAGVVYAPVIVQRRVRGDDVRVMVLDGEVISAAAIGVPVDTLDFRGDQQYASGGSSYDDVALPAAVLAACERAAALLGLRFCGFDIKRGADGSCTFLECNNSPIYVDVERKLGHAITERLCAALLSHARPRPVDYTRAHDAHG